VSSLFPGLSADAGVYKSSERLFYPIFILAVEVSLKPIIYLIYKSIMIKSSMSSLLTFHKHPKKVGQVEIMQQNYKNDARCGVFLH